MNSFQDLFESVGIIVDVANEDPLVGNAIDVFQCQRTTIVVVHAVGYMNDLGGYQEIHGGAQIWVVCLKVR